MAQKETEKGKKAAAKKAAPAKKGSASRSEKSAASGTVRVGDFSRLMSPIFTEKSSFVGSSTTAKYGPTVVFRVLKESTKQEIREAIERAFNVQVERVRTSSYMGKVKRTMRSVGRRAGFKKAYVTLKQGNSISVVEGL